MAARAKGTGRAKGSRGPAGPKTSAAANAPAKPRASAPRPIPAEPATTDPATTDPATTDPATTDPATTDPATTDPATTEPATTDPATTGPEGRRPAALRLAATAQLIEALGLGVAAVFGAISTAEGKSHQLAAGVALTLLALGTAAGLAAIAVGLARARPWSRIPAVMTQVFVVIAGITLLDGNRPEWGVPALVLAGACVAGLLTPASLRALNRPPVNRP
jgi:hypothetical protein